MKHVERFQRPLRATHHCRHYSYVTPITDPEEGPHCASGIDLKGQTLKTGLAACMPDPKSHCPKREDYTDEERAVWDEWVAQRMDRLREAILALPRPIPLRSSGKVECPNCGSDLHYSRWHRGAAIACKTENCCEARFSIEAGKDWPA